MIYPQKIVLIGFMGSGKTTIGKRLANQLNISFVDLDEVIVEQEGVDITTIFESKGENYFREIEHKKLKEILTSTTQIILSTGGGTPCFYNNMKLINAHGVSVYLKYSAPFLVSRLEAAKTARPLLKNLNNKELNVFVEKLLSERASFYLQSNCVIEKINIKVGDVLAALDNV